MLQNRRCRRSGKSIEKEIPKVIKIELKIWPWALKGLTFEIWGGFRKYCFSMNFRSAKQKRSKIQHWRSDGRQEVPGRYFGGGSAERAGSVEALEFADIGVRFDAPLAPRSARLGWRSMGYCLFRRSLICELYLVARQSRGPATAL